MTSDPPSSPSQVRGPWRPRFGLGTLLLAMLVVSVMAAAGSYMVRAAFTTNSGRAPQLIFMLFTLAAPMLLAVIVSVVYQVFRWLERSRRQ